MFPVRQRHHLRHGIAHHLTFLSGTLNRAIGSFRHHDCLVHAHIKHPFAPQASYDIRFPCIGKSGFIKQVCDSQKHWLLVCLVLRYPDAYLAHVGIGQFIPQLHRVHALGHTVEHMVHAQRLPNHGFTGNAVEHGQYDRILPNLVSGHADGVP